ncbi:hypothetical protein D3C78_1483280 [compost metagenome]
MARDGEILLHLVEFVALDHRERVFLAVDGVLLKAGVDLGERHRHGVGAQDGEGFQVDRRLDDADLQALHVFKFGHRVLAVGQVTETQVPITQPYQPLAVQLRRQFLPDRPIDDRMGFLDVVEQEREIEHGIIRRLGGQDAGVEHGDVQRATLQRRHRLHVAA